MKSAIVISLALSSSLFVVSAVAAAAEDVPPASPAAAPVESATSPAPADIASPPPAEAARTAPAEVVQAPQKADEPGASVAFVANPIALLFRLVNADVGVAVADNVTANVAANYWSFVYPALEYAHSKLSIGDYSVSGSHFGPSAMVGYQWNFHPFTVRLAGGGRYYFGKIEGDDITDSLAGLDLKLDGSIGLAF